MLNLDDMSTRWKRLVGLRFSGQETLVLIRHVFYIHTFTFSKPIFMISVNSNGNFSEILKIRPNRLFVFSSKVSVIESYCESTLKQFVKNELKYGLENK